MKLLLDEHLSRRIVPALQDAFPGTTQVALVGLEHSSDRAVWDFAKAEEFTIVTKDDDFLGLLSLLGYPPKVVLLATALVRKLWQLYSSDDGRTREFGLLGLAVLAGILVKTLTDDILVRDNGLLFWALMGMVLGAGSRRTASKTQVNLSR